MSDTVWWKSVPTIISVLIGVGTLGGWIVNDLKQQAIRDYQFQQLQEKVNELLRTSAWHEAELNAR